MEYKALFVHIPKTGGASISTAPFILKYGSFSIAPDTKYCKQFTRFSFVRNPYERYASAVLNLGYATESNFERFTKSLTMDEIMEDDYFLHLRPMTWYLHTDEGDFFNHIGRFENLQEDWNKLCRLVGEEHELPHKNASGRSYDHLWTPELKRKVYSLYEEDFIEFNYKA